MLTFAESDVDTFCAFDWHCANKRQECRFYLIYESCLSGKTLSRTRYRKTP